MPRGSPQRYGLALTLALVSLATGGCYNAFHSLPEGVSYRGGVHPSNQVGFLADVTWVNEDGSRHVEQHIFDAVFEIVRGAERFLLVDMFLYNDFQGESPETTRALSAELTHALIEQKRRYPELRAVVVSDPVNTVYGGIRSKHFDALREAGIPVVITRLEKLRDSNPAYSGFWRIFARPLGKPEGGRLSSPFGDGKVNTLSYMALLNFKANHRKLVIADAGEDVVGLVTSGNPHDGSSAHGNVAATFRGAAAVDLLRSENAVIAFSDDELEPIPLPTVVPGGPDGDTASAQVQVVTEGKIRELLLSELDASTRGDRVDIAVFYLSDHGVVKAIVGARKQGAAVRVLLDPNKDAFGYEKNGVPNRPVAADLHKGDVPVRWCDTHGEQCHAKLLLVRRGNGESLLLLGSANFTRRNLQDFNLETDVAIRGSEQTAAIRDAASWFDRLWSNEPGATFSVDYEAYADDSLHKRFEYQVEERTGMSTF
jgi:phosphatidylserine/phosphatidylglycerophosphate/cardiolipin synthase-like enzyme